MTDGPGFVCHPEQQHHARLSQQRRARSPFLRVQLRGPIGNPTAIGARITVELADGSTQVSEVYAGSGYYSQSTAACFFGSLEGNPPKKVRVRWPAGVVTEQSVPAGSDTLLVSPSITLSRPHAAPRQNAFYNIGRE